MGLMSFIKSQFIEIIEWLDDTNYTLVHRFPDEDHEIKNGAKLVCREGQAAILVNEGQMADVFGPGTHTLSTENMPILSRLKGWKYGFSSPFKVEVYFVNLRQYLDQKWGTPQPIIIRDPEFGVNGRPGRIRIRAFGNYNFRITDPGLFFKEVVGTQGLVTTDDIERYTKSRLLNAFGKAAASSNISVADMYAHVDSLSEGVRGSIQDDFAALGLALTSFIIESISVPPEVEKALDAAAVQAARGVDNTMAWEAMQGMRDAARNTSGGASQMMGAGMGMGMGMGMGNMMGNMMGQAGMGGYPPPGYPPQGYPQHGHPPQGYPPPGYPPQGAPPPQPQQAAPAQPAESSLEDKLRKLKAAFEAELLTEEEYKAKRAALLSAF